MGKVLRTKLLLQLRKDLKLLRGAGGDGVVLGTS